MFASKTIAEHLLRGLLGGTCLIVAVAGSSTSPWLPIVLLPLALLALRGCPTCWALGLAQTFADRFTATPRTGRCADGRCAGRTSASEKPGLPARTALLKGPG
jgi:hypothetical protein